MNSDTISRQAVLNATSTTLRITGKENAETVYGYIKKLCDDIKALPPIQPDVILCKDCKYYKFGICMKIGANKSFHGFCDWAERREDETD